MIQLGDSTKSYTVWLIFRRTRHGGLILIAILICLYAVDYESNASLVDLDTFKRYINSGMWRYSMIASDLGKDPADLPWNASLLNGLPANTDKLPDIDIIRGIQNLDFEFDDYRELLESCGMLDNREVVVSISGFDGFLAKPSALLQVFDQWTAGWLVIAVHDRHVQGFANHAQTGIFRNVWVHIPSFCQFLEWRAEDAVIARCRDIILRECVDDSEIQEQERLIEAAMARKKFRLPGERRVDPQDEAVFEEVLRGMEAAVREREYLKSSRNTFGPALTGRPVLVAGARVKPLHQTGGNQFKNRRQGRAEDEDQGFVVEDDEEEVDQRSNVSRDEMGAEDEGEFLTEDDLDDPEDDLIDEQMQGDLFAASEDSSDESE